MKKIIAIICALTVALLTFASCGNAVDENSIVSEDLLKEDVLNSGIVSKILEDYNITNIEIESRETDLKKGTDNIKTHINAINKDESVEVDVYMESEYTWKNEQWELVDCDFDYTKAASALSYKPLTDYEFDETVLKDKLISLYGFKDDMTYTIGEVIYQKDKSTFYMVVNAIEIYKYATDYHEISIDVAFDTSNGYWSEPVYNLKGTTTEWNNKAYFAKEMNATEYIALSNEFLDGEMPTGYKDAKIISTADVSAEEFFTEHAANQAVKKSIEAGASIKFNGLDYDDFMYCAAGTQAEGEAIFIGKDNMAVFDKDCYTIIDSSKTVLIDLKELIFIRYIY